VGIWRNELGSNATIAVAENQVAGTYQSAVSAGGGATVGDLVGWVGGDLISMTVRWRAFAAITAWVGQVVGEGGADAIDTLWHMTTATPSPAAPGELWDSVLD
jgi:hypothetical protein